MPDVLELEVDSASHVGTLLWVLLTAGGHVVHVDVCCQRVLGSWCVIPQTAEACVGV